MEGVRAFPLLLTGHGGACGGHAGVRAPGQRDVRRGGAWPGVQPGVWRRQVMQSLLGSHACRPEPTQKRLEQLNGACCSCQIWGANHNCRRQGGGAGKGQAGQERAGGARALARPGRARIHLPQRGAAAAVNPGSFRSCSCDGQLWCTLHCCRQMLGLHFRAHPAQQQACVNLPGSEQQNPGLNSRARSSNLGRMVRGRCCIMQRLL